MQGKIHDKDNKHHTFPWEVLCMPQMAECGGGNPERNDERFLEDWGEPLMATQPKKMFILTSYDETFRS